MSGWRPALAALLTWAAHFFIAYALMLAFPGERAIGWLTLGLGLACLAVLAVIVRARPRRELVLSAAALSGIAILWQSVVGLF